MRSRPASLLLACLLAAPAGVSAHEDSSKNPDRWPTVDVAESGSSSFKGDNISYQAASNVESDLRYLTVATPLLVILPLADPFTLTVGAGANWAEQDTVGNANAGATASSNSQGTWSLSARWYFEERDERVSRHPDNPDQWPSAALTGSGASTFHYSNTNASGDTNVRFKSDNVNAALDARWPVADAWTLTANAGAGRSYTRSDPTAFSNGVLALTDAVTGGAGFRYYLVGRDTIRHDAETNPDRWPMLSLALSTSQSVRGRQTVTNAAGAAAGRDSSSRVYTAAASARLPVTDHLSLRFDLTGSYNRGFSPRVTGPAQPGTLSRFASLGFQAGLRYFFF